MAFTKENCEKNQFKSLNHWLHFKNSDRLKVKIKTIKLRKYE